MSTCVECDQAITHPVCDDCLANEFKAWLMEIDASLEEKFTSQHLARSPYVDNGLPCIICGNPIDICPTCAGRQLVDLLHRMTLQPKVMEWVLDLFMVRGGNALPPLPQGRRVRVTLGQPKATEAPLVMATPS